MCSIAMLIRLMSLGGLRKREREKGGGRGREGRGGKEGGREGGKEGGREGEREEGGRGDTISRGIVP